MIIQDVNLNAKEWCDIVFEGKNQKYGAYYLRKTSSRRHLRALIIIAAACLLTVFLPLLINQILPKEVEVIDIGVEMTNIDEIKKPPVEEVQPETPPPPPPMKPELKFTVPEPSKLAKDSDDVVTQTDANKDKRKIGDTNVEGETTPEAPPEKQIETVTGKPEPEKIETIVEVKASFPGGQKALTEYLSKNLNYPPAAKDAGDQGRVIVRFVVTSTGEVKNAKVIKSSDNDLLDEEAIRVIKGMKNWIPGSNGGKPVSSYYNQPIDFVLSK